MALMAVILTWTQALAPASCDQRAMSKQHEQPAQDATCAVGLLPGTCIGGASLPDADIAGFISVVRGDATLTAPAAITPRIFAFEAFHPPKA